ncbi:hypothetical protein [Pseudodesulfovibrio sediminis]|uniref:Uncharacterized protein n=1 Tax=Pseudodesulfovibrio sediminis TaxID=2810563 RepID=A0ABM7P3H2_9BACT|nr:hypothetical protein [Pseudodesulfovibrio sediminis]BCS87329.1 hypothetical protein PSDVSF_05710 [Pseudodesulfovibrio sediminis]
MSKKSMAKLLLGGSTALNLFGNVTDAEEAWKTGYANRQAALKDAQLVQESGDMDIQQLEREGRQLVGSNLNAITGSNTAFSGSAMDIMADTMAQLELQKRNKQRETASKRDSLYAEANNAARSASSARQQGYLKAGGTLLRGVGDFMDMF